MVGYNIEISFFIILKQAQPEKIYIRGHGHRISTFRIIGATGGLKWEVEYPS